MKTVTLYGIGLVLYYDHYEAEDADGLTPPMSAYNDLLKVEHKGEDITDLLSRSVLKILLEMTY